MMEYRVRSKRSDEWAQERKGAMVTMDMVNLKLEGPARVMKPNGKPLLVYLPGAVSDLSAEMYDDFSKIRRITKNRGYAAGATKENRVKTPSRAQAPEVMSAILGSIEMSARKLAGESKDKPVCRLTAFTAQEVEHWHKLMPMFQRIAELLEANVPDRYAAQAAEAARTHSDWVIKGTPFTTITVNNTYPTGIHTDKGDLDEGFSTLVAMRRGGYTGGWLTFPQYGLAADMQDGDLLLMDAHEWHGNTPILCARCEASLRKPGHKCEDILEDADLAGRFVSPERVSIVSYFRTLMTGCGSMEEEEARRQEGIERSVEKSLGLDPDPAMTGGPGTL